LFVSSQPVDSSFVLFAATGLTGFCCCFSRQPCCDVDKKKEIFSAVQV